MSKHKGIKYTSDFSFLLEEQIEVPYKIVGYPEWLERAIPGHLKSLQIPVRINREAQDLVPVLTDLWQYNILGLDLENGGEKERDGLDPVSSTSRSLLGQFGHRNMVYLFQPELIIHLKEPLESPNILKINQNIEYDFKWLLWKHKIHVVRMYCTMLAEQILRAGRDGFGVKLLDLVRYHACRLISKEVRNQFIGHTGVFTEEQLYYAARDVGLLFDVFDSQNLELKELGLEIVAKDEFNCIPATAEMELTGVFLDTAILNLSIDYYARRQVWLEEQIMEAFNEELRRQGKKAVDKNFFASLFAQDKDKEKEEGDGEEREVFDLDSAEQKLEALRRIGLTLENVQRGTLKKLENKVAKLLVEYSEVQKIVSTYGLRLVKKIHPDTGRLHPEFKQLGLGDGEASGSREKKATIATGRFSSDFQQLPRPKEIYEAITGPEELALARKLFAANIEKADVKLKEEVAKEWAEEKARKAEAEALQKAAEAEAVLA